VDAADAAVVKEPVGVEAWLVTIEYLLIPIDDPRNRKPANMCPLRSTGL
jgi:hypothetical protein